MDEFGVLVESIGFKAQGKSAPMADLKHKRHVDRPKSVYNSYSTNGSFHGNGENQNSGDFHGFDDVFGGFVKNSKPSDVDGFDLDFISNNSSMNSSMYVDDDIFGGMPAKQSAPVDDLFGDFGGMGLGSNGSRRQSKEVRKNSQEFDDLIPGFGGSSPSRNSDNAETSWSPFSTDHAAKSTSTSAGDPFIVLEQSSSQAYTSSGIYSKAEGQDAKKGSVLSSVDELENFATGGESKYSNNQPGFSQKERAATATHDLDSFFNMGSHPNNMSKAKSTPVDPVFDSLFQNRGSSMEQKGPRERETSGIPSSTKKPSSQTTAVDDFSFFFGGSAPPAGEFQEIKGESEERRRARLNHHNRTQQRMAKALAEKNQRDLQTQQEQEERHRIAETLNYNIKRWAAGKEGNLRALLSSLQDVLWPECGWQPVSLTDLITSGSVKKVYHKATLCVHPDKVQQKGANVQQKYTAEKVFDLLKDILWPALESGQQNERGSLDQRPEEAWNKFTVEELR